jgi:two-component system nitrogen regulation response regulator GlnG
MSEQKSFNKNIQPESLQDSASLPYSLSGHKDKLLPLVNHFIKKAGEQLHTDHKELSKETEDYLLTYDWPGGEKELETAVKKACILSDGAILQVEDFDLKQRQAKSIGKFVEEKLKGFMQHIKKFDNFNLYDMVIPEVERSLILMILKETNGNQIKAAKLLGINRNTLRTKIKKLKISMKNLQK